MTASRKTSIEAQNEHLEHWETNWAAKRIHDTERQQVQAMFERLFANAMVAMDEVVNDGHDGGSGGGALGETRWQWLERHQKKHKSINKMN